MIKRQAKAAFSWKDAEGSDLYLSISPRDAKHPLHWVVHPGGTWDSAASSAAGSQCKEILGAGQGGVAAPCSYLLWLSVPPLNQLRCLPGSCRGIFALRHSCTRCNTTHNSAKPTSRPIKCDRNIATGSSGPGSSFIYFAFFSTEIKVTHMIE